MDKERLTIEQIEDLVKKEIVIDSKKHCYQERRKRDRLRLIAIEKLKKKHGYK